MDNRSQEFLAKAKDILKKITFSGGEGYIIGSSVLKIINEEISIRKKKLFFIYRINLSKKY